MFGQRHFPLVTEPQRICHVGLVDREGSLVRLAVVDPPRGWLYLLLRVVEDQPRWQEEHRNRLRQGENRRELEEPDDSDLQTTRHPPSPRLRETVLPRQGLACRPARCRLPKRNRRRGLLPPYRSGRPGCLRTGHRQRERPPSSLRIRQRRP